MDDEEQLDAALAHKQKKIMEDLEFNEAVDKDMEDLDTLEQVEQSLENQMWDAIDTWLIANKPQPWHDLQNKLGKKDLVADVRYTITIEKNCNCPHNPNEAANSSFKVFTSGKHGSLPTCAGCDSLLLAVDETSIVNIDVHIAPPCMGCGKALYELQEGMLRCCDKCDSVWTKMNKVLNPGVYDYQMTQQTPLEGQILRRVSVLNGEDYSHSTVTREIVAEVKNANIITSEVANTHDHKPVLDIDLGCKLIPSTHAGHYHLYVDKQMTWDKYRGLLKALSEAEVIEHGYYMAAIARKYTAVRLPWIKKETNDGQD